MKPTLSFFQKEHYPLYNRLRTEEGFEFLSITEAIKNNAKAQEAIANLHIVDVSSLSALQNIQYNSEDLINQYADGVQFIADIKHKEFFEYEMRYCFSEFVEIDLTSEIEEATGTDVQTAKIKERRHKRIIDLKDEELSEFVSEFRSRLYGHEKFKDDFAKLLRNFRVFNRIGEHKILSIFIMGDSGVGKTEVARAIHKSLGGTQKLAKINFGNYSSDNALNSLIGSPRGYIGSDEGEIFIRVDGSDTGLILIDEFEKSNSTLFNYFLDVLESGKMVSSQAEEIDLNGFIIIFTSNISKEDFALKISPELRSRFDYKSYFTLLYQKDKRKFVEFRVKSILAKFHENYKLTLPSNMEEKVIQSINVESFKNMRELNKSIKDTFVTRVSEYVESTKEKYTQHHV